MPICCHPSRKARQFYCTALVWTLVVSMSSLERACAEMRMPGLFEGAKPKAMQNPDTLAQLPNGVDISSEYALTDVSPKGWMLSDSATRDGDGIKLTSKNANQKGQAWHSKKLSGGKFHVRFWFEAKSDGGTGGSDVGDGFAWFFADKPEAPGSLYGSNELFNGVMIGFDSFDDDEMKDNPIIMTWLGDGKKPFNHTGDGKGRVAGCRAQYRNRHLPMGVDIQYHQEDNESEEDGQPPQDFLKVMLHMGGTKGWETCMVKQGLKLSPKGFMGFSAANRQTTGGDEVKLVGFKLWDQKAFEEALDKREQALIKADSDLQAAFKDKTKQASELVQLHVEKGKHLQDALLDDIMNAVKRQHNFFNAEVAELHRQLDRTLKVVPEHATELQATLRDATSMQAKQDALKNEISVAAALASRGGSPLSQQVTKIAAGMKELQDLVAKQGTQQSEHAVQFRQHKKAFVGQLEGSSQQGWGDTALQILCVFQMLFVAALYGSRGTKRGATSNGSFQSQASNVPQNGMENAMHSPYSPYAHGGKQRAPQQNVPDSPYSDGSGGSGGPQSPFHSSNAVPNRYHQGSWNQDWSVESSW